MGIIPSSVPHESEAINDDNDIAYAHLYCETQGEITLPGPRELGDYDLRMNDTDYDGNEVTYTTFTVASCPVWSGGSLKLNKSSFSPAPGESITVTFTVPETGRLSSDAWVGVIPSSVPHGCEEINDANCLEDEFLNGKTSGTITFAVAIDPGSYDVRMNDTDANGSELTSVTFTVVK